MTPEEIAAIEADDAALVANLGNRPNNPPPWYMLQGRSEDLATMFRRAAIDRRALLAHVKAQDVEIERLRAQVAAVERVRDRYKKNMDHFAGSMFLQYCDPYVVARTAVRDLDAALSGASDEPPLACGGDCAHHTHTLSGASDE